jgi:class 3 adenylate cyclase
LQTQAGKSQQPSNGLDRASEVEVHGDHISGIGVHVAHRVMENADAGQIWVSGVVPLLMTGSEVEFRSRGERALKGVPGEWSLFELKD